MLAWLRHGASAAKIAGDRADLWPAGALAWLAYIGWLPLILVVARPDPNGLPAFGVSIYTSSAFPGNVIALAAGVVAAFAALSLLAATGEVTLQRAAGPTEARRPGFGRATLTVFSVMLASSLPAAVAFGLLLRGLIAVAPAEFQSPDIGTPILVRLAGDLMPYLLALAVVLLLVQAFAGLAIRRAHAAPDEAVTSILTASAQDLLRRPWSRLGVAGSALLLDLVSAVVTFALLSVLWSPIGAALDAGRLAAPDTLLLLLGFVAIWLALLLAAGAVHVAISAWWAMELACDGQGRTSRDGVDSRASRFGSETGGVD
ncbi:MAG: hypothetical protein ABJC24_06395 [Chloroflexota bacterium]